MMNFLTPGWSFVRRQAGKGWTRKRPASWMCFFATVLPLLAGAADGEVAGLRLIVPAGYVASIPVLVRVELIDDSGARTRRLWDAEVSLSAVQPGITLSTNRVFLRNGMGSTLVNLSGGGDVTLTATLGSLAVSKAIQSLEGTPEITVSGVLPGAETTWSGIVRVASDVTVPTDHTLTILPGTWVLMAGVASGTGGADLIVNGEVQSLGTESTPVTFTCSGTSGLRWGQIRHSNAQPSSYRHTIFTLGGRAPGEGHTGQAPVLRTSGSRVVFNGCSMTDFAGASGTPGKIMQSSSSDLVMTNCLLSRARMGPEIGSTALQFLDSYIIDMRGPDDADGIYLHSQGAGQTIRLVGSVVAGGDDDGIDTLGANITVDNCIVRGWRFPGDDSKGISVFGGECRVWRSLLVDNTIGLSGKGGNNENVVVRIDHCTILGNAYGVAVTNKSGTTPIIDYRITNSIIRAPDAVFTQYLPEDIHIDYSVVDESWPGTGNLQLDPLFSDVAVGDFRLQSQSPCIDSGDPGSPRDPDGSLTDMGFATFLPPPPVLGWPIQYSEAGFQFVLSAFPNRNYVIEISTNGANWVDWKPILQVTPEQPVIDTMVLPTPTSESRHRFYRARLAP